MFCNKCGKENEGNVNFCIYCGNRLNPIDDLKETEVLKKDDNFQPSSYFNIEDKPPVENTNKRKKVNKGAIIAIVVACIFVLSGLGVTFDKIIEAKKAENAISDLQLPDSDWVDDESIENDLLVDSSSVDGNIYYNSLADAYVTPPSDDWQVLFGKDVYEYYISMNSQMSFDENNQKAYIDENLGKTYFDCVMIDYSSGASIQITVSNTNLTITDGDLLLDSYLSNFVSDDELKNDVNDLDIAGKNYKVIKENSESNGVMFSTIYAVTCVDNDIFSVVYTTLDTSADPVELVKAVLS